MGKSTIIIIGVLSPGMVLTVPLATGNDSAYVLIDYGSNAGGVKQRLHSTSPAKWATETMSRSSGLWIPTDNKQNGLFTAGGGGLPEGSDNTETRVAAR